MAKRFDYTDKMIPEKIYIEQDLSEWNFYPYKNLKFIWEIDEKNKTSILYIKEKRKKKNNE